MEPQPRQADHHHHAQHQQTPGQVQQAGRLGGLPDPPQENVVL